MCILLVQFLPLRFISRRWGEFTSVELPLWLRPYVYHGWARAFHANLEEASWPVEEYPSLRAFFIRKLKDGARPLEISSTNLISPVDGVVVGYGQVKGPETMIEQVVTKLPPPSFACYTPNNIGNSAANCFLISIT